MRYIVVKLDVDENDIIVLNSFEDRRDALEYMSKMIIDEDYNKDWYKVQLDDENRMSVYKLGYILEKKLKYRYFIRKCKMDDEDDNLNERKIIYKDDTLIQFEMD